MFRKSNTYAPAPVFAYLDRKARISKLAYLCGDTRHVQYIGLPYLLLFIGMIKAVLFL